MICRTRETKKGLLAGPGSFHHIGWIHTRGNVAAFVCDKMFRVKCIYSDTTETERIITLSELKEFVSEKHPGLIMYIVSRATEQKSV